MDGHVERFVNDVAGCGMFQVLVAVCAYSTRLGAVWAMVFMSFGSYNPGWECVLGNATQLTTKTDATQNYTGDHELLHNYTEYNKVLNVSVTKEGSCEIIDTCVQVIFSRDSSTVTTQWGLVCGRSWIASVITSVQMVGITVGAYLAGWLADSWGRKVSLYAWVLLGAVSNAVAAFSTSWQMFAALRLFIGLSVGGTVGMTYLYPFEFLNSKWRGSILGIPHWPLSVTCFGVLAFLLRDWQTIHMAIAVCFAVTSLSGFWAPESLRWLAVNGKHVKSEKLARKICRYNKKPPPQPGDITFLFCEQREKAATNTISTFRILLRKPLLKRVIFSFSIHFSVSIMYYAIVFGIQIMFGDFYINFVVFSLFTIPAAPLIPLFGQKLGRRLGIFWLMIIMGMLALAIVVIFFALENNAIRGMSITIIAIIIAALADAAWSIKIVMTSELFPTSVRATGYSLCYLGGRLGGIVAPYVLPGDYSQLYVSYLVMMVLSLLCCAMVLALPETKGQHMECDDDETGGKHFLTDDKKHIKTLI